MMAYGNIYKADVTNEFEKDTDYYPILREEIEQQNSILMHPARQANIVSVKMTASSTFKVQFLYDENPIEAELLPNGTDYGFTYVGGFQFIKFVANTTLTELEIDWFDDAENWKTVSFDIPENASITVQDSVHGWYYTPDVNDKYYLQQGVYILTITDEYSNVSIQDILILESKEYTILTPGQTSVVDEGIVDVMKLGY
jgi:hypothetical protein